MMQPDNLYAKVSSVLHNEQVWAPAWYDAFFETQNSKASFIKCTLGSLLWHPSKSRHYTTLARHHPMYQNQASTTKAIPKNVFISWLTNKKQALYKGRLANWIYSTYHLLLNKYHLFSKCQLFYLKDSEGVLEKIF